MKKSELILLIIGILLISIVSMSIIKMYLNARDFMSNCEYSKNNFDYKKIFTNNFVSNYCKSREPKGYKSNYYWGGCSDLKYGFTCGYTNRDGATLYKCFKWVDVIKEILKK